MKDESSWRAHALLDTNIIVYAYDETDPVKWGVAADLLEKAWGGKVKYAVSTQNLAEFYRVVTSKIKNPIPPDDAFSIVRNIIVSGVWTVIVPDADCLLEAMNLSKVHGIGFWDAHIIAAAKKAGISTVITENTKDFCVPGIKAVNPFED